ncbi:putative reverse transcriptase domain-containing protein [Tanacetum coccineum]
MLVDALLQHEVEGQVNRMVEKVRGLEIKQEVVEVAKGLTEVAKEVVEVAKGVAEVAKDMVEMAKKVIRVVKEVVETICREAVVGMAWEDFKVLLREECCPNNEMQKLETEFWCHVMVGAGHATYTDRFHELARNGALKKNTEKTGNNREPGRDGNVRNGNKRYRTGREFATITNPVRKEYTSTTPKCPNCNYHHPPEVPCRLCTNCNRFGHIAKDCGVGPWVVNPLNARNPTAARGAYFEYGGIDHYKATCPRHRSFDVIVGMDWLSRHKAEIVFHEKVVRIPLPNGAILRILGERPEEKVRHSKSAKVKEQKLKDIVVVRNFSEVFPDDLLGLPPSREIKFRIDLIPGAMSIAKSPYRLTTSKMEELSSQLRQIQDKGFIRPSSSPWGAPILFVKKRMVPLGCVSIIEN